MNRYLRRARAQRAMWGLAVGFALATNCLASSVMIWPIDPTIGPRVQGTTLWLENNGQKAVTVQIRVVGWNEQGFEEVYKDHQNDLVVSPPFATIEQGKRQMVRLIKTHEAEASREASYRIFVDEMPFSMKDAAANEPPQQAAAVGINIRMRYSLPLFVYGEGMPNGAGARGTEGAKPRLNYQLVEDAGKSWLVIENKGLVHARLTNVRFSSDDKHMDIAPGLLGYALAGSKMRWPVSPSAISAPKARLIANVNDKETVLSEQ